MNVTPLRHRHRHALLRQLHDTTRHDTRIRLLKIKIYAYPNCEQNCA